MYSCVILWYFDGDLKSSLIAYEELLNLILILEWEPSSIDLRLSGQLSVVVHVLSFIHDQLITL